MYVKDWEFENQLDRSRNEEGPASRKQAEGWVWDRNSKNCPRIAAHPPPPNQNLFQGPLSCLRFRRILIRPILFKNKREGTLHRRFLSYVATEIFNPGKVPSAYTKTILPVLYV
jgi:hypothetical protein